MNLKRKALIKTVIGRIIGFIIGLSVTYYYTSSWLFTGKIIITCFIISLIVTGIYEYLFDILFFKNKLKDEK